MGSSDKEKVYEFMATGNRPFGGNDVFSSLQRRGVGRSAVDKALDQLARENRIVVKLNGKQKIYCVAQPDPTPADQDEIRSMDEALLKTGEALREVERECGRSEAELKTLRGACSTDEAARRVAELEEAVSELRSRLERRRSREAAGGDAVPAEDRERVRVDYERYVREYKKRKRSCTDVLDSILENCPKTKRALFEEIGVETDESVGMPSLQ